MRVAGADPSPHALTVVLQERGQPVAGALAHVGVLRLDSVEPASPQRVTQPVRRNGRRQPQKRMRHHRQTTLRVDFINGVGHRAKDPGGALQEKTYDVILPAGRDFHSDDHLHACARGQRMVARAEGSIDGVVIGHGHHVQTKVLGNRHQLFGWYDSVTGRGVAVQFGHAPAARRCGRRVNRQARTFGSFL